MKTLTIGIYNAREDAEKTINRLHAEQKIENDDISYLYKNTEGEIKEVDASEISSDTTKEGAKKGAKVGGTIGALAGIAAIAGIIPGIGPLLAAGPIVSLLGLTGAVGAAAGGAAVGAATGGIIGALSNLGVSKERAKIYSDRVNTGDILVTASSEDSVNVERIMSECGAEEVETYGAVS